jgi:ABC-type uncharacterized transport system permease subunit
MTASDPALLLLGAALVSATPILYAALGELLIERAGVLNLGIEGTMLVGAVTAFMAAHATGSGLTGMGCAVLAAAAFGGLFAALVVGLRLNQVVTGLAMTILGSGLSAFLGQSYVGLTLGEAGAASAAASGVHVAAALACAGAAALFLWQTRPGPACSCERSARTRRRSMPSVCPWCRCAPCTWSWAPASSGSAGPSSPSS